MRSEREGGIDARAAGETTSETLQKLEMAISNECMNLGAAAEAEEHPA